MKPPACGTAITLTLCWMGALVLCVLNAVFEWHRIPYIALQATRWLGAAAMAWLFCAGLRRAARGEKKRAWHQDEYLLALVLFWALFPPSWFFTEYLVLDLGAVSLPPGCEAAKMLENTKTYASFASNIWIGAGTVFGLVLAKHEK